MNRLSCLIAELGEDVELRSFMSRHTEHCLRCQVRAARDHRIRRHLRALRGELETAPVGLAPAVESRIDGDAAPGGSARHSPRILGTAGAVVAGAAGAVAVTLWRRTHSPA